MVSMLLSLALLALAADDPFRFRDGDRVVWLGGTLIEREQQSGHWEAALTVKNRPAKVSFRNLGWSGDTVWGESRNGFDESPKGFERLVALTTELKPTVLVVCYGQNESFAGEAGLPKFRDGLNKLLDALAQTKARVVLMTPPKFTNDGPVRDGFAKNTRLAAYAEVIRATAAARRHASADLFQLTNGDDEYVTENGVHPGPEGYKHLVGSLLAPINEPPVSPEPLRQKIVAKNRLFFHRWRPQNETYLFGFRKHEQGKNAAEVAAFDPLVAAAEAEIQALNRL
jgi:lysophospholipase L1-like esterase